jgi:hypothetical protein
MSRPDFQRCRRLVGVSAVGLAAGFAPALQAQDTEWIHFYGLPEVSAGLDVDASTEQTRVSGGNSTYDHLYITPLAGLHTTGYAYHPNLLSFDLTGEGGWGWDDMVTSGGGSRQTSVQSGDLLRYTAQFDVLAAKPYNGTVYASQDHTFQDYGSFDTYTVDAQRYGTRLNWAADNLTLNADLGYRDEDAAGLNDSSRTAEKYFNFIGLDRRKRGQTTLTLRANDLENTINSGSRFNTTSLAAGLSDSETLGGRGQISESSGLSYAHSEYSGQQQDTFNATENVLVNHRPSLDSYLVMNFNRSELRPLAASTRVQGSAGLRHRLYESLASTLEAHGSYEQDHTAGSGNSTFDNFGVSLSENYTKRLQSWGRLSAGTGVSVDHQDQNSPSGTQTIIAEPHDVYLPTSPNYHPVFLNQPKVVGASVSVSTATDTLVPGTDYTLVSSGDLTEVRLVVPPSAHVQSLLQTNDNLAVTVTYQCDALNQASYETVNLSAQVRLDLFGRLGIYARFNNLDNNAPSGVLAQTLRDLVGGADFRRKWFRAGAEYEDYNSSYTQYRSLRFFQNFDFTLSDASALGVDFNQSFYNYAGGRDQSQYDFRAHYNVRLPLNFTWYLEGGAFVQEYAGYNLTEGMARTGLGWVYGKLSLRMGYEYNTQSTTSDAWSEGREKHRFFAYLRRTF